MVYTEIRDRRLLRTELKRNEIRSRRAEKFSKARWGVRFGKYFSIEVTA